MTDNTSCVVFDIDDTLYLERDYVRSGFAAVGVWIEASLGLRLFSDRCWIAFRSGRRRTIFDEVLASYGVDEQEREDLVVQLVERYRRHHPVITLLSDADEMIDRLRDEHTLAALSDGPLDSQRAKVRALGLAARLDRIVLTEEIGPGRGKPDPAGFELIREWADVAAGRCVYVADNPLKDFGAPSELGWMTVRVRRAGGIHQHLPTGPDVDVEVTSLHSLDQVLGGSVRNSVRP